MPQFQAFKERKDADDIAIRQFMAWSRCKAYTDDGSGGIYLFSRIGSSSFERHVTASELTRVRSSFIQSEEFHAH